MSTWKWCISFGESSLLLVAVCVSVFLISLIIVLFLSSADGVNVIDLKRTIFYLFPFQKQKPNSIFYAPHFICNIPILEQLRKYCFGDKYIVLPEMINIFILQTRNQIKVYKKHAIFYVLYRIYWNPVGFNSLHIFIRIAFHADFFLMQNCLK